MFQRSTRRKPACRTPRLLPVWLTGSLLGLAALPASAQTPMPLAEWQYSAGVPLEKLYGAPEKTWAFRLGIATSFQPKYEGSSHYRVRVGPSFDLRYDDLLFASTGEGIGVNLIHTKNVRAGLAITYDLGRRAADNLPHLRGFDNISPAPEVKLFGEYAVSKAFPLVVRGDIRRSIGGTDGWVGDLGAYMPLPGSSKKFYWFAGPNLTFADERYMNHWYGVTGAESMRSGLSHYSPGAGLKSVGFGMTSVWFFRKHWFVTGDAAVEQFVGEAARSPVTQRSTNVVVDLSLNYQF